MPQRNTKRAGSTTCMRRRVRTCPCRILWLHLAEAWLLVLFVCILVIGYSDICVLASGNYSTPEIQRFWLRILLRYLNNCIKCFLIFFINFIITIGYRYIESAIITQIVQCHCKISYFYRNICNCWVRTKVLYCCHGIKLVYTNTIFGSFHQCSIFSVFCR